MAESLRDQLAANLETLEQQKAEQEVPAGSVSDTTPPPASAEGAETPAQQDQRLGRTAGRARDEKGRLLPGKAAREESAADPSKSPTAPLPTAQAQTAAPAAETKPRPARPSTWKKDYWDHWEKIDPALAEYLVQREGEFAKGVSTYKGEYDKAKPLVDAMAEFTPLLQQHGIEPTQWIKNLGNAHRMLALGTPQEKLGMFARLVQDYQIPIEQLFVQGQDGRTYLNPQVQQFAAQPRQQQQQPLDVRKLVQEALSEHVTNQEIERMRADTKTYPHFETVRETMAGLLRAGLADDLASAYDAALRHPRHSDIWDAMQRQQREADEKRIAEEKRKQAEAARRNVVSVKTSTPTGQVATQPAKGLRSQLESNFDAITQRRV